MSITDDELATRRWSPLIEFRVVAPRGAVIADCDVDLEDLFWLG
jgi:hypothetical protein